MSEYMVVSAVFLQKLVDEVNRHIKEGWTVSGGISACSGPYCQAMVR